MKILEPFESGRESEAHFSSLFSKSSEQKNSLRRAKLPATERRVIILAGGEGERMRETITSWLGHHRPKQYCTFVGTRSMLQHTVDRARALVPDNCITTVIGRNHLRFLQTEGNGKIPGRVLEQPSQKDTGPGVFFALAYIIAENPDSTVIIFPSDQYIVPEGAFLEKVDRATALAQQLEDRMILMAAVPDRCETDYGWIRTASNPPSPKGFGDVSKTAAFIEKPSAEVAESCYLSGCYWNTMVMVVKARTLWDMGWQQLTDVMNGFETLRRVLVAARDGRADPEMVNISTHHLYSKLAPVNFSRCVLEKVIEQLLILPLSKVTWSDWGRPSRIAESLAQRGKVPRFLLESSRRRSDQTEEVNWGIRYRFKQETSPAEGLSTA